MSGGKTETKDQKYFNQNQVRLVGSHGLQGGIPWLRETDQTFCPLSKSGTEDLTHFL